MTTSDPQIAQITQTAACLEGYKGFQPNRRTLYRQICVICEICGQAGQGKL